MIQKFYFTFGSWEGYPYQNTYLIVAATSLKDAIYIFRKRYPDRKEGIVNCAFWYMEDYWKHECAELYKDQEPAEIIFSDAIFAGAPEGFCDVSIYVPSQKRIIRISEGSGDNLSAKDIENGYVDYVYYSEFNLDGFEEVDGGILLCKKPVQRKYKILAEAIPDVLAMAYDNMFTDFTILT